MAISRRVLSLSVAGSLSLAAGMPLAAQVQVARPHVTVQAGTRLVVNGMAVYQGEGRIAKQRVITFSDSPAIMITWEEQTRAGTKSFWAYSRDGRTVNQVQQTENKVRLRYATFDPAAGEPGIPEGLAAGGENRLFLVQFVGTPLEEMRREIRRMGGVTRRFMTDNTHVVEMPAGLVEQVSNLPYVRWVGAYHPAYRLDTDVLANVASGRNLGTARYSIECMEAGPRQQQELSQLIARMGGLVEVVTLDQHRMEATLTHEQLMVVLQRDEVNYVDPWLGPGGTDMDIARQIGGAVPILSNANFLGQGVRGEIFDTEVQSNHPQWGGQVPLIHGTNGNSGFHGSACYGINFATGAGNAQATGLMPQREQGIFAWYEQTTQFGGSASRLSMNTAATNPNGPLRSVFQTSSVGSPQVSNYTTISAETDDYLFKVDYLSCQSQSNTGNTNSRPQAWAKNIVAVGGIQHNNTLTRADDGNSGASIGPASDGRMKPELAHFYDSIFTTNASSGYTEFGGTSGATPITAGHFGLLHQMWHEGAFQGFGGGSSVFHSRPKSTTARALMVNGAYRYPLNQLARIRQGFGMADIGRVYQDREKTFIVNADNPLEQGQAANYSLQVGPTPELRITMVYPDPQGNPSAAQHRINDLTLKVTDPNGGVYWGNNGHMTSNFTAPGGSANTIDTVENVFVQDPIPGTWQVEVIASQIVQDGYLATPAVDAVYSLVAAPVDIGPPPPLYMNLVTTLPGLHPPGMPLDLDVNIVNAGQNYVPGSGKMFYRMMPGGGFTEVALSPQGGVTHRATLPPADCGDTPEFYFTAQADMGGGASLPLNAPANLLGIQIGTIQVVTVMEENFDSGLPSGWTVNGLWNIGGACPPGGSCGTQSWAYYGQPSTCTYNTGVSNQGTMTMAPVALPTVPPGGSVKLTFCHAKISEANPTYDKSEILVNGNVVASTGEAPDWQTVDVDLTSFAGQTVTIGFRFNTVDGVLNDFRGWHVDNIKITAESAGCVGGGCYANCDGSTAAPILNVADFTCFLTKFAAQDPYANCDGSTTPPVHNVADFTCFLTKFAAGC
jgi:serine protease AprX